MTSLQIQQIKTSWTAVATIDPIVVGNLFYNRLFAIMPETRAMFRTGIPEQSKKLLAMLGYVIAKLDKLDDIIDEVRKLAIRHVHYGVKETHYTAVGSALLWTLEQGLGTQWTDDLATAWTDCYTLLSGAMMSVEQEVANAA